MRLMFTISGAPRTKKNSRVHATYRGRVIPLPSKAWTKWASEALIELPGLSPAGLVRFKPSETIRVPVNCRALFYRDANRGDACGYYQGLADLLEKRGVVENDRLIVSWDGSRLLVDRENPRTEVTLETGVNTKPGIAATCDRRMCSKHRTKVGPNLDHCGDHTGGTKDEAGQIQTRNEGTSTS